MKDERTLVAEARALLETQESNLRRFMRELCATPSVDGDIAAVLEKVRAEVQHLGYDDVTIDSMGCLVAAMGEGPTTVLYDAHLDTVGIGERADWEHDPFEGRLEGDVLYARGACDTKGCIPGMVYGIAMARELGLLDGMRLVYYGSLEEQCDGQAPRVLVEVDGVRPDYVVIGEPTDMQVYHGQRGRVEMAVRISGRSAHASMPQLGDNPLYKLAPILEGLEALNDALGTSESPVRAGSIAATDLHCTTASINAVPSEAVLYIDRRLALGEDVDTALAEVRACVPEAYRERISVDVLTYDEPSYNGFRYPVKKVFPAWRMPEEHPYIQAGLAAYKQVFEKPGELGLWPASTNGTYWNGVAEIPSLGFGPGNLKHAHRMDEQVRMQDVVAAALFYALLPSYLKPRG